MKRVSLIATAMALACTTPQAKKDGAVAESLRVGDFYPLAVGNRWTYRGKVMGQSLDRTITVQQRQGPFFVDDAGAQLTLDAEGLRDRDRYLLRGPLQKGTAWTSVVSPSSTERYEIVDAGFVTDTPAGTFRDCVLVRGKNREMLVEWTYAPGVGMVRMMTFVEQPNREPVQQSAMELVSYSVKP